MILKKILMTLNYKLFNTNCASMVGINKKYNQDAFGYKDTRKYFLAVVADGLGSARSSHIGSTQTIKVVQKSITEWRKLKRKNNAVLLQLIHFYCLC